MNSSDPSQTLKPAGDNFSEEVRFIEIRAEEDFDPKLYPKVDGSAAPGSAPKNRNERITLEFCGVYYALNRLYMRLWETRNRAEGPARNARERATMQEIEKHLRIRDELEDRYAPYGVIAEAIAEAGVTVNIKFTFGNQNVARSRQTQFVSSSALLIFPKPSRRIAEGNQGNNENQP
jgi:hypothetical protein